MKLKTKKNGIDIPAVIFGTSCLGNLYEATPYQKKLAIVQECITHSPGVPVFDTAGKYGAGLSLEVLGRCLGDLGVAPDRVLISNKLGWYQTELTTPEPTFEKGIWREMKNDAVQKISYQGILDCFEQGNKLLGKYRSDMVSVHDPDEYLAAANDEADAKQRYQDILGAYEALGDLKREGKVKSVGVGSKDWKVIRRITHNVQLDWVMIANSLTVHSHPRELVDFVAELNDGGVKVINSAVFNGGFLTGGNFYNYTEVDPETDGGRKLLNWRDHFNALCKAYGITPAEACFNFSFNIKGISAVALNTTKPENVKGNITMAGRQIPQAFWEAMAGNNLIQI